MIKLLTIDKIKLKITDIDVLRESHKWKIIQLL